MLKNFPPFFAKNPANLALFIFPVSVFLGLNSWKISSELMTHNYIENTHSLSSFPQKSWVYSVAISPDHQTIVSGNYDKSIKILNLKTGKLNHTLRGHADAVESVAISPDGKIIASGSWDNKIKLWDLKNGRLNKTLSGHLDDVKAVAFSPDGKILASASWDKTVKLWNVETGQIIRTLSHSSAVRTVAISPDGQIVASGCEDGKLMIWQLNTGELKVPLAAHNQAVRSVAFSSDSQTLASGSSDQTIKLWNSQNWQLLHTLEGHNQAVHSVVFSPDGETLASGDYAQKIHLWNTHSGQLFRTFQGHHQAVWSVVFSPDGKTLASGSGDETIKIWSVSDNVKTAVKTPESSKLERLLTTQPEITNAQNINALNRQVYDQINQAWQNRTKSPEDLAYRVGVTEKGEILAYQSLQPGLASSNNEKFNSELLDKLVVQKGVTQEPIVHFRVVFNKEGILEVSPWHGWRY